MAGRHVQPQAAMCERACVCTGRALRRKRDKSQREKFYADRQMQDVILKNIEDVVVELFVKQNEVPFIATYRKEVRRRPLPSLPA